MPAPTREAVENFAENWEKAAKDAIVASGDFDLPVFVQKEMTDPNVRVPKERIEVEFIEGAAVAKLFSDDDDPETDEWSVYEGTLVFSIWTKRAKDGYTPDAAIKTRHRGYMVALRKLFRQDGNHAFTEARTPYYWIMEEGLRPDQPDLIQDDDLLIDQTTFPWACGFRIRQDAWPV